MPPRSVFILILTLLHLCVKTDAQNNTANSEPRSIVAIRALRASVASVESELQERRQELNAATTAEEKTALSKDIVSLNTRKAGLMTELESVITGIDVETLEEKLGEQVDLGGEVEELLRPIIQELKKATSKPREVEALRAAVAYYTKRRDLAKKAVEHLDSTIKQTNAEEMKAFLDGSRSTWQARLEQYDGEVEIASFRLAERLKNDDSLLDTLSRALTNFFGTRGKNFLLAVLASIATFLLLRFVRRLIGRTFIAKRFGSTSFAARLFNVVFHAATIVLSIMAALTTLYSLGDWMLLGLSILFLVGLAWATKATIPRVFEQVKLMLNLGSVREGERIVFHGVPWKVERINVFTDLVNPSLDGGHMRVPLRDLIPLVSRHSNDDEPYFPCKTNDWVMLADATYGKVVKQTPEWVQLVQLGSARVTYATADFVAQNPKNLSHGFRIHGAFGIDYQHQPICTTEVPKVLLTKLKAGLTEIAGEESLVNLNVEFQQAGPSSLDYAILADFTSAAASNHNRLNRAIQRICVDTCNEKGWVIPFTQVTIHNAA